MPKQTFDPKKVVAIAGVAMLEGWVDGEFITAEKGGDTFTMKSGADGNVCRVMQNHPEGTVTFKVMASSPINDILQAMADFDAATGFGAVPLLVKDFFGTTLIRAGQAWIRRQPNYTAGRDVGTNEWIFDCADLSITLGGNF